MENTKTTESGNTNAAGRAKIMQLTGVTAGYNDKIVLEDVHLTVFQDDFLGIVGSNGSGKTTLLKIILGLLSPMRGKLDFYLDPSGDNKKYIGYMPQASMFDKKFPITVRRVVLSGLTARVGMFRTFNRDQRAQSERVMEQMGVAHLADRAIGELSGGQMQRVFLSRALISSPRLLVLDEPNTYVDKSFEKSFYEILVELNKEMAIIMVSHDIGMISSYVKSIACVCRRLHYHDTPQITQELLDSYNCPIDLISHGHLPHRVLKQHDDCASCRVDSQATAHRHK